MKFKDYRPNEYFLVENHLLKTMEQYVFFAVSMCWLEYKNIKTMG
ncbi:hypothetical protein DVH26_20515 [Paenibacillus sp. H1-7]|nr:hypothetical protein DVH26_20515 [Paenibacillus sp. H1-7]